MRVIGIVDQPAAGFEHARHLVEDGVFRSPLQAQIDVALPRQQAPEFTHAKCVALELLEPEACRCSVPQSRLKPAFFAVGLGVKPPLPATGPKCLVDRHLCADRRYSTLRGSGASEAAS